MKYFGEHKKGTLTIAWAIANTFRIAEYEDMISPVEFATLWHDKECMVIYPYYLENNED